VDVVDAEIVVDEKKEPVAAETFNGALEERPAGSTTEEEK
jgi:hypothetical protein